MDNASAQKSVFEMDERFVGFIAKGAYIADDGTIWQRNEDRLAVNEGLK